MVSNKNNDPAKPGKLLAWYNMVPNLVWSALCLIPVSVYCYTFFDAKTFYIFLAISFFPLFLRNSFLTKIQISNSPGTYKKLGVHIINRVAQNGDMINAAMKKRFPGYKAVTKKRTSIDRLIKQTYFFEKFHLLLFVFFSLVTAY